MKKRKILMTSALPYANGDIHLGHLVEYIQSDIWARFQKMRGHDCRHVCADDAHGTPVMLRAEAENESAESLIARMKKAHEDDLRFFGVDFDNYHSTHSPENQELSETIFRALRDKGLIESRDIEQLFDEKKGVFLPDRYVRGECPRCGAPDQYGDSCEACGASYAPAELKNPKSVISGAPPRPRRTRHYFFALQKMSDVVFDWARAQIANPANGENGGETLPRLQPEAVNKLNEWSGEGGEGLRGWDISRDAPYFGFRIPDVPEEVYFYVWLDAPIGYMASFKNLCAQRGAPEDFDKFWRAGSENETELYHFIGKDILYFHGLFWPAMLSASGHRLPTRLFVHGFLTVNGEKMSKSRGTFITAARYRDSGLNPEWLRYYYAAKLNDRVEDLDLNLADFRARINSDLVGKLINIPSRVAKLLTAHNGGALSAAPAWIAPDFDSIAAHYESRRYFAAMRDIMRAAEEVNRKLEAAKPWLLAKRIKESDSKTETESESAAAEKEAAQLREQLRAQLADACTAALQSFRLLIGLAKPALPQLAADAEKFLNIPPLGWSDLSAPMAEGHKPGKFAHLMTRMEESHLQKLTAVEESDSPPPAASPQGEKESAPPAHASIKDFARLDLRVAVVREAEAVEESEKLLRLKVDIGDGRLRQVFAGLKQHARAEDLIGKQVLYLANLSPRKMRFGVSEGMVLAAVDGEKLSLLSPHPQTAAGAKVR